MSANFNPIMPCEKVEVYEIIAGPVTPKADPEILSAEWRENSDENDKISVLGVGEKCHIEIRTQGFDEGDELTLEIKENQDDAVTLKTISAKIKENVAQTSTDGDQVLSAEDDWYGKQLIVLVTSDKTDIFEGELINVVCCKHAIKKDDEGNLIKELNIKLAGFGEQGNTVPKSKFDELTENAVKQFQRDYMKVPQTGIVCKHFLEKLDEFCNDYYIKIETDNNFNVKCPCITKETSSHRCLNGFGIERSGNLLFKHSYKNYLKEYQLKEEIKKAKNEEDKEKLEKELAELPYETKVVTYPGTENKGMHRSLLWAISAMVFYLKEVETTENLEIGKFYSSYRCKGDNIDKFSVKLSENKDKNEITERTSINHMGNAVDIHVFLNGKHPKDGSVKKETCDKVREQFIKYAGSQIRWEDENLFNLEPSEGDGYLAKTWVHIDCRDFNPLYKKKDFYCTSENTLKGEKLMDLLKTSDGAKFEKVNECSFEASTIESPKRINTLWIGLVKGANSIVYQDNIWSASTQKGYKPDTYRKQNVVAILDERDNEYKIQPRGEKSDKIGWVNKKYIKEICKYEKDK